MKKLTFLWNISGCHHTTCFGMLFYVKYSVLTKSVKNWFHDEQSEKRNQINTGMCVPIKQLKQRFWFDKSSPSPRCLPVLVRVICLLHGIECYSIVSSRKMTMVELSINGGRHYKQMARFVLLPKMLTHFSQKFRNLLQLAQVFSLIFFSSNKSQFHRKKETKSTIFTWFMSLSRCC